MLSFTVTFFITIVNLLVLFLILRKLLFKPVTAFIEKRAQKVKSELADAAMTKGKAEELVRRYEGLLSEADAESERLLKEAGARAGEEAKDLLDQARVEAAKVRERGEEAAERERAKARDALSAEIASLAAGIAARLVGREAAAEDGRAAEAILKELEAGHA